jgi:hypothetical protein
VLWGIAGEQRRRYWIAVLERVAGGPASLDIQLSFCCDVNSRVDLLRFLVRLLLAD